MKKFFTRSTNMLLSGYSYISSSLSGRPVSYGLPPAISAELTNYCNLSCPDCMTGSGRMTRMKGFMSLTLFDKIVTELRDTLVYMTLNFQGESMMHPGFFNILRKARGIRTSLSTNGHFLTRANAEKLAVSGLHTLIVSLDGMDQGTYSSYRIGGDLETVMEGIRNMRDAIKRLRSPLKLEIQFLVNKINEHQLNRAGLFASEMKASFRPKSMQIVNDNDIEKWLPSQEVYSRYKKSGDTYNLKNKLPDHCARLWLNPVITWNGKVLPCCFDKDEDHVLGDLNEDTFRDIWNGPKYRIFRRSLLSGRYMTDICRNCTSGMRHVRV